MDFTHLMPIIGTHTTIEGVEHVITRVEFDDGIVWDHPEVMPQPTTMAQRYTITAVKAGTRRAHRAEHPTITVEPCPAEGCEHGFVTYEMPDYIATRSCTRCMGAGVIKSTPAYSTDESLEPLAHG